MSLPNSIACRVRFQQWLKERHPNFSYAQDLNRIAGYYRDYIMALPPAFLIQEWEVGSNWKRNELRYYIKFFTDL